jgi:hypothetical protein
MSVSFIARHCIAPAKMIGGRRCGGTSLVGTGTHGGRSLVLRPKSTMAGNVSPDGPTTRVIHIPVTFASVASAIGGVLTFYFAIRNDLRDDMRGQLEVLGKKIEDRNIKLEEVKEEMRAQFEVFRKEIKGHGFEGLGKEIKEEMRAHFEVLGKNIEGHDFQGLGKEIKVLGKEIKVLGKEVEALGDLGLKFDALGEKLDAKLNGLDCKPSGQDRKIAITSMKEEAVAELLKEIAKLKKKVNGKSDEKDSSN